MPKKQRNGAVKAHQAVKKIPSLPKTRKTRVITQQQLKANSKSNSPNVDRPPIFTRVPSISTGANISDYNRDDFLPDHDMCFDDLLFSDNIPTSSNQQHAALDTKEYQHQAMEEGFDFDPTAKDLVFDGNLGPFDNFINYATIFDAPIPTSTLITPANATASLPRQNLSPADQDDKKASSTGKIILMISKDRKISYRVDETNKVDVQPPKQLQETTTSAAPFFSIPALQPASNRKTLRGAPIEEVIAAIRSTSSCKEAAAHFGVTASALSKHLRNRDLTHFPHRLS